MTLREYAFRNIQIAKDVVRETSKKYHLTRPFNKRHGKPSQTMLKSEGQHLYQIY